MRSTLVALLLLLVLVGLWLHWPLRQTLEQTGKPLAEELNQGSPSPTALEALPTAGSLATVTPPDDEESVQTAGELGAVAAPESWAPTKSAAVSRRSTEAVLESLEGAEPSEDEPSSTGGGRLSVLARLQTSRLKALDLVNEVRSELVSPFNWSVGLAYAYSFSKQLASELYFEISKITWRQPDGDVQMVKPQQQLYAFGVNLSYRPEPRWSLGAGLEMRQHGYLRATTLDALVFDSLYVPRVQACTSYDLYRDAGFALGLGAQVTADLPGKSTHHEQQLGFGYGASMLATQRLTKRLDAQAGLFYSRLSEKTSLVEQNRNDLGLQLKVSVDLGASDESP